MCEFALVIDPSDPNTLYAGCSGPMTGGGVFKSMDGGATWSAAGAGLPVFQDAPVLPHVAVNGLSIDPKNPGTLYATLALSRSSGGIFKSTDGAASWSPINAALPAHSSGSVTIDPHEPNTLYTSMFPGGLFRSTDGGSNWAIVSTEFISRDLTVDPEDSGTLYGLGSNGLMKSTDDGGSWSVILPDVAIELAESGWLAVAPGDGGASTVYAGGSPRGVFKSPDGGSTWATANSGLIATWIDSVAIDPQNPRTVYAGVSRGMSTYLARDGVGLFQSTDGAATWSAAPALAAPDVFAMAFYPPNPGIVYAATSFGVQKSLDGGQSWAGLTLDPEDEDFYGVAIDFKIAGTIYAGGFKSTDGGASWVQLAGNLTTLASDPQNSGTIYAGSNRGTPVPTSSGVLKSVDGGATWSGVNTLWQVVQVSTVAVDPTDSNVVYAQTGSFGCFNPAPSFTVAYCSVPHGDPVALQALGLYKSADGGATWTKLDLPGVPADQPIVSLLGIDPQGGLYVWVSAQASLITSQDRGATWNALPTTGLPPGARAGDRSAESESSVYGDLRRGRV